MTPRHPFDTLARPYRWLEAFSFGPLLQRCRTAHLSRVADCRRALVVGDGDGRFLAALLASNPAIVVDALDISPRMTALARRRTAFAAERVRFTVGDIQMVSLPLGEYDLIVTNFLLDCFAPEPLAEVVRRLSVAATPDARWLVGDFAVPPGRWTGRAARFALAVMYAFFRISVGLRANRLIDPFPLLEAHGFERSATTEWLRGFLVATVWRRDCILAANGA